MSSPSSRLRALLDQPGDPLVVPGVGTPLEAHLVQRAGFDAVYVSGYSTAAFAHGVPDIGLIALGEISVTAQAVVSAVDLPTIVDVDTGYGDVASVAATVRRLERSGVAGVQLEDQQWPKRCGHLAGKSVEPVDVMLRKLDAAQRARRDDSVVIIARTDARAPLGLEEALDRARRYHDAGADVTFVDAPESVEELQAVGGVPGPKLVNMSEGGRTPILPLAELGDLGFRIVLYPTSALRVAASAMAAFLADLRAQGDSRSWLEHMLPLDELNAVVGLDEIQSFEQAVLEDPR